MSVLINDMEMPKSCWLCPLSVLYEKPRAMLFCRIIKEEVLRNKVDGNCPLVEVHTPHGRLIDADSVEKQIDYVANLDWNRKVGASGGMFAALEIVEDAPTIIESEK